MTPLFCGVNTFLGVADFFGVIAVPIFWGVADPDCRRVESRRDRLVGVAEASETTPPTLGWSWGSDNGGLSDTRETEEDKPPHTLSSTTLGRFSDCIKNNSS